jgi:tetratricopeptide (TPR) repeat protein
VTPEEYHELRVKADELHEAGDLYGAIDAYGRLLSLNDRDADLLVSRSAAYIETGEYNLAATDAIRAWEQGPENAVAAFNAGLALDLNGQSQEAVDWFRRAIETDATFAKAYAGLANTYSELRDYAAAITYYELAEEHGADFDELYYWWGRALMGVGRYEEALECLERRLADGESLEAEAAVAQCYYLLGETDLARGLLNKAASVQPEDHDSLLYYMALLRQDGLSEEDVLSTVGMSSESEVSP